MRFGALFCPNEVLETHLAPFLDQLSALEQNKNFCGTVPTYKAANAWIHTVFVCALMSNSVFMDT